MKKSLIGLFCTASILVFTHSPLWAKTIKIEAVSVPVENFEFLNDPLLCQEGDNISPCFLIRMNFDEYNNSSYLRHFRVTGDAQSFGASCILDLAVKANSQTVQNAKQTGFLKVPAFTFEVSDSPFTFSRFKNQILAKTKMNPKFNFEDLESYGLEKKDYYESEFSCEDYIEGKTAYSILTSPFASVEESKLLNKILNIIDIKYLVP